MQGEQYREAWAASITVPIVYLDTLKGGLKIIEQGGGKQTHSLELEDNLGIRYTLRSVSKNPEPLVPDVAVDLHLENIIIDGISAQHPYAALVVANLSDAAKVLHTQPNIVFVPKQPKLGKFNDKFGNRLFLFEYESEGKVDWTGLPRVIEIVDTEDLQEFRITHGEAFTIDRNALIRARLFDLLIGDWDRHAKQWGWAIQKNEAIYTAIPVAADRDNAFFDQDGIIPKLIANNLTYPEIQDFNETINNLEGLISDFDEYFLRQATLQTFELEATKLQELLSDSEIERAFRIWPKSIDDLNGEEIRKKLKARRDDLNSYASQFHTILSERPLKKIILKGSEQLQLKGKLSECFDCTD